jgi:hypothetical protein
MPGFLEILLALLSELLKKLFVFGLAHLDRSSFIVNRFHFFLDISKTQVGFF